LGCGTKKIALMTLLLLFSLFFPRISLFIAYLAGGIPHNNVPLFFDVFGLKNILRMTLSLIILPKIQKKS
jgi:hypothetical protein